MVLTTGGAPGTEGVVPGTLLTPRPTVTRTHPQRVTCPHCQQGQGQAGEALSQTLEKQVHGEDSTVWTSGGKIRGRGRCLHVSPEAGVGSPLVSPEGPGSRAGV